MKVLQNTINSGEKQRERGSSWPMKAVQDTINTGWK